MTRLHRSTALRTSFGKPRRADIAALAAAVCFFLVAAIPAAQATAQRWPPQYKIKPHEHERLTAADVVGPDGIVYPDWRYAGIPGGIPEAPEAARAEQFGARADDGQDDSAAIQQGVEAVGRRGGGALVLGAGTYHLDRSVFVPYDGVVIRGQGPGKTKLVFRYGVPEGQVVIFLPSGESTLGPDDAVDVHAAPGGLNHIELLVEGRIIAEASRHQHWGGTFARRAFASQILRAAGAGKHRLVARAAWDGGRKAETTLEVTVDPANKASSGRRRLPASGWAALLFHGDGRTGERWQLAADGRRGDLQITLAGQATLRPGDAVELLAPATDRWNRLVENACQWGLYRCGHFRVESTSGNRVALNQPLRIDFPTVDGSYVEKLDPIRRCGVENLCLEQTQELWTCGILFDTAWECWVRNVRVEKAGQHPAYTRRSKWCEIQNCEFDDAWYHGGGGTAYVGWERSYDCLMDLVTTWRMRHAPCVQWSSSGNVIRRSTFHGSDAQWHAGWTNENLFELCTIDAAVGTGSYGHGGWASPPNDQAHGPEGPRNVVYNCDFRAPKTGLWMGGMNENWLIVHNRFVVEAGPGIVAQKNSFDHIIRGNVIAVQANKPAVQLADADCTGVELEENRIFGGSETWLAGLARPLVDRDNVRQPFQADPPRPKPLVPSIFQWQRTHPLPAPIRQPGDRPVQSAPGG